MSHCIVLHESGASSYGHYHLDALSWDLQRPAGQDPLDSFPFFPYKWSAEMVKPSLDFIQLAKKGTKVGLL